MENKLYSTGKMEKKWKKRTTLKTLPRRNQRKLNQKKKKYRTENDNIII